MADIVLIDMIYDLFSRLWEQILGIIERKICVIVTWTGEPQGSINTTGAWELFARIKR